MCGRFIVAVSCILVKEGKVLIAKRKPKPDIPLKIWEFPSGRLEENEDPEEGLIREMKEEIGVKVIPMKLVDAYKILRNGVPTIVISYICKSSSNTIRLTEHSEFKWVDPKDLENYFEFENQKRTAIKVRTDWKLLLSE